MSEEKVEVIKRGLDAVNRGDFAAAMATCADDVVLVVDERVVPLNAGVFTGRDAVGDGFADWFRSFASGYQFHIQEMRPIGKRVFLVLRHVEASQTARRERLWQRGRTVRLPRGGGYSSALAAPRCAQIAPA